MEFLGFRRLLISISELITTNGPIPIPEPILTPESIPESDSTPELAPALQSIPELELTPKLIPKTELKLSPESESESADESTPTSESKNGMKLELIAKMLSEPGSSKSEFPPLTYTSV